MRKKRSTFLGTATRRTDSRGSWTKLGRLNEHVTCVPEYKDRTNAILIQNKKYCTVQYDIIPGTVSYLQTTRVQNKNLQRKAKKINDFHTYMTEKIMRVCMVTVSRSPRLIREPLRKAPVTPRFLPSNEPLPRPSLHNSRHAHWSCQLFPALFAS